MKIIEVKDAQCSWCDKEKECCEVEMPNGQKTLLCWKDLQRMAKLTLTQKEQV